MSYRSPYQPIRGIAAARHGSRQRRENPKNYDITRVKDVYIHRIFELLHYNNSFYGSHHIPGTTKGGPTLKIDQSQRNITPLTLLERIPWCDFAPLPIALEAPREAWGSLGWTARAPSTTLSAKYFSVSPRISICDRANMACSLKG